MKNASNPFMLYTNAKQHTQESKETTLMTQSNPLINNLLHIKRNPPLRAKTPE